VAKSCLDCPSYLTAEASPGKFRKSVGAPMCGRYGKVLGKPGASTLQLQNLAFSMAEACDAHGQPMPPAPVQKRFEVALPDPTSMTTLDDGDPKKERCVSCSTCTKFVRDDVVVDELGWISGLCTARGKLILPIAQSQEARDCMFREFGSPRTSTTGIQLLPVYDDAFHASVGPIQAYAKRKGLVEDPRTFATEAEVTDEDSARGIRAWRKIKDQAGTGNEVLLPIYDSERYDDNVRVLVPQVGDDEHPEDYIDHNNAVFKIAVLWTRLDETPSLWGMAGVGKTEIYRHMAWLMQLPFHRISITGSTELDDLAGKMHFSQEKGTYFEYGRIPRAWQQACVICLDEPNVGPPDVWQFIRPLTDNSKQLVLDMNEGEAIPRHDDCYMGLAQNPAWDPRNVGAATIGDADGSRLMHISMELPPQALEREIIKKACEHDGYEIENATLDMLMRIAGEIRPLCDGDTLPITWGIRPQIKVARALRWFDPVSAYRLAAADYLEPQQCDALLDTVRAHMEIK
jgi:MoxR-like ATPase